MSEEISNGVLAERIGAVAQRLEEHIGDFKNECQDAAVAANDKAAFISTIRDQLTQNMA